jgi:predicted RNA-binding protein with PUA-like domain
MAYWLLKSDPETWSWQDQTKAGRKGTFWDGVRNHSAKLNLMAMKVGEQAFFYHSGEEKKIVGIVEIIKPYYPDPTDKSGKFGMVDVRAVEALKEPVTLNAIKQDPRLANMELVKYSRLSVQKMSDEEWNIIRAMGGL